MSLHLLRNGFPALWAASASSVRDMARINAKVSWNSPDAETLRSRFAAIASNYRNRRRSAATAGIKETVVDQSANKEPVLVGYIVTGAGSLVSARLRTELRSLLPD